MLKAFLPYSLTISIGLLPLIANATQVDNEVLVQSRGGIVRTPSIGQTQFLSFQSVCNKGTASLKFKMISSGLDQNYTEAVAGNGVRLLKTRDFQILESLTDKADIVKALPYCTNDEPSFEIVLWYGDREVRQTTVGHVTFDLREGTAVFRKV